MAESMQGKIKRQVEYYFNDFNLMRDQFLKNEIKLAKVAGNNGFISLETMLKFNRLAQLTTDVTKIVSALEESKLVELNEEKTSVRRNPERKLPVDDELYRANLKARTCYADGFPRDKEDEIETKGEPASLDEIFEFIEKADLTAETVAMRKLKGKKDEEGKESENAGKFTGSVFITFLTVADCKSFVESEEKFRGTVELTKMTKHAYWSLQNAKNHAKKTGGSVEDAVNAAKKRIESEKPAKYEEGCVIVFSGVKDATIKREDVKEFLVGADAAVEYIQFESGKEAGAVLLNLEHGKKASEVIPEGGKQNIKGDDLELTIGDEAKFNELQEEYMSFKKRMSAGRDQRNNRKGGGGGGKRGQYKGKTDRRGGDRTKDRDGNERKTRVPAGKRTTFGDDDATPAKVEKREAPLNIRDF